MTKVPLWTSRSHMNWYSSLLPSHQYTFLGFILPSHSLTKLIIFSFLVGTCARRRAWECVGGREGACEHMTQKKAMVEERAHVSEPFGAA